MPRGGFRPGAGRKKAATVAYQATRRDQLQVLVTDPDWEAIVRRAVEDAKNGDYVARQWLTPYVAGKVPEEVNVHIEPLVKTILEADLALMELPSGERQSEGHNGA